MFKNFEKAIVWWRCQRLHFQLIFLSGILISASLFVGACYNATAQSEAGYKRIYQDAIALSKNISITSAYHIASGNLDSLEELLLKSIDFPDVMAISIRDTNGEPLSLVHINVLGQPEILYSDEAATVPSWLKGLSQPRIITYSDYMHIWYPIFTSSNLGWVRIEYDMTDLIIASEKIWHDNIIASIIFILFDILILVMILHRPMKALTNAGEFALNLHKKEGHMIDVKMSSKEVNDLMYALNQTSLTLKNQRTTIVKTSKELVKSSLRLAEANINIEEKVQDRTKHLSWEASHDSLTKLFNRRAFVNRLKKLLTDSASNDSTHYICYIDLDNFKSVNDTCGHIAGDELLKQVCGILSKAVRKSDTLARLGGDEFGAILLNCPEKKAKAITETMLKSIKKLRFAWENHVFTIGASIGLVEVTEDSHDIDFLLNAADTACYAAKENGRNQIQNYDHKTIKGTNERGETLWSDQIKSALAENRLCLYRQLIKKVNDDSKGHEHYEIFVRMRNTKQKIFSPGSFMPAAERSGLTKDIDQWVIDASFHALHKLLSEDSDCHIMFNINLSEASICDEQMKFYITEKLNEYQIPSKAVCFEISETVATSHLSDTISLINSLREKGCDFALDHFGSGLASFSYLKKLAVDYIKIDGDFINDMLTDNLDMIIVESVNKLGHAMGIQTIASVVESKDLEDKLESMGVDYVQGYFIDRPKPIKVSVDDDQFLSVG